MLLSVIQNAHIVIAMLYFSITLPKKKLLLLADGITDSLLAPFVSILASFF
jgi:hypothetical protein